MVYRWVCELLTISTLLVMVMLSLYVPGATMILSLGNAALIADVTVGWMEPLPPTATIRSAVCPSAKENSAKARAEVRSMGSDFRAAKQLLADTAHHTIFILYAVGPG